jgi:hypothetical protein
MQLQSRGIPRASPISNVPLQQIAEHVLVPIHPHQFRKVLLQQEEEQLKAFSHWFQAPKSETNP